MKHLLKINIALTLVLAFVCLASFATIPKVPRFTHHLTANGLVVKDCYRHYYDYLDNYWVFRCPDGLDFDCELQRCDFPHRSCGCVSF